MKFITIHRASIVVGTAILFFNGCNSFNACKETEILRKASQDNIVEVVVVKKDCGATTSTSESVYIVPKGGLTENTAPLFVADHVVMLEPKWRKPRDLIITYKKARIFKFKNFWNSKKVDNFLYNVAVQEKLISQIPPAKPEA